MKNCIFTTFDDGYFLYAKAFLNSFEANYPDHPPIKVLYNGTDQEKIDYVNGFRNVDVLDYKLQMDQFESLNLGVVGSPMIFVRFILWSELFDEYENVVYLDCDTVILKPFDEVFEKTEFFCVIDNPEEGIFLKQCSIDAKLHALLKEDQMEFRHINKRMINSGFFLLPRKYRTQAHKEQIWSITRRYNQYIKHSDQSVISLWIDMNKLSISEDYRYNFQTQFIFNKFIHNFSLDSIKIMHFSFWKPDKNYGEILIPANYVLKALETFHQYAA